MMTGRALAILTAGSILLASCGGGGSNDVGGDGDQTGPSVSAPGRQVDSLTVKTLWPNNGQQYRYRQVGDRITVTAPQTNDPSELGNDLETSKSILGEVFWETGQPDRFDQQVCVRLDSVNDTSSVDAIEKLVDDPGLRHLPGIALRVKSSVDDDSARAITITQSNRRAAVWVFDVSGIRIDGDTANQSLIDVADFRERVGVIDGLDGSQELATSMRPPPWNLCARAIGSTITLKLWLDSEPEPSWSDPEATREVKLTPSWVYSGYAGGYELGLSPGHSSKFTGLEVTSPY